ncbi:hypothetical protein [Actinoalloteichus hymeniacidonis]|uniref:Uncharacterized protein n=1 Tax=Actinoalloteichus hymeniacidonis TaxID=340345 RepID=A0AAC9HVP4_9PSEU|nr:hypothetical protein [Actinoalloteichus hymeniacidonis]AOS65871.1 hypothetical protein TL08_25475 [Actinoalloteichus hymeniacidonis]MBB5906035.1 hypothetical protein [Actinoalloteichus hymeniacidonis]
MTLVEMEQRLVEHRVAVRERVRDAAIDRARLGSRPRWRELLSGWLGRTAKRRAGAGGGAGASARRAAVPVRSTPVGCAR